MRYQFGELVPAAGLANAGLHVIEIGSDRTRNFVRHRELDDAALHAVRAANDGKTGR